MEYYVQLSRIEKDSAPCGVLGGSVSFERFNLKIAQPPFVNGRQWSDMEKLNKKPKKTPRRSQFLIMRSALRISNTLEVWAQAVERQREASSWFSLFDIPRYPGRRR